MPVTDYTISRWYDFSKRGIIVFGIYRCRSNLLTNAIQTVIGHNSHVQYLGEILLYKGSSLMWGQKHYSSPSATRVEVTTQINSLLSVEKYSISSILSPVIIESIIESSSIMDEFTTVKLLRTDFANHLMSQYVHSKLNRAGIYQFHSGLKKDIVNANFKLGKEILPEKMVTTYIANYLQLLQMNTTHTVVSDDLMFTHSDLVENNYGCSPNEFFANYEDIVYQTSKALDEPLARCIHNGI